MKRIGIIPNVEKDIDLKVTKELIKVLSKSGFKYLISEECHRLLGNNPNLAEEKRLLSDSDIIICLGGDGTFLNVARKVCNYKKPILGINLGNLGFLTELDINEIDYAVKSMTNEDYHIEERMVLSAYVTRDGHEIYKDIAINDFVVSRSELSRILHLNIFINDELFDNSPGDGLIISTPTGSTAYSLSAGGPIVEPRTNVIIMTPICSHTLTSRPLITSSKTDLKIIVREDYTQPAMFTVDGQKGFSLKGGDEINICTWSETVKLLKLYDRSFINILRNKIYRKGVCVDENEI